MRDINNGVAKYFENEPTISKARIRYEPSTLQTLRFLCKILIKRLSFLYQEYFTEEIWSIGFINQPIESALEDQDFTKSIHFIECDKKHHFIADPFGMKIDNKIWILYEHVDWSIRDGNMGQIMYVCYNGQKIIKEYKIALNLDHHSSYPFLLKYQNEIYCIPETHEKKEISLYHAERFPDKWRKVCNLVENIPGIDPTVFKHNGRWWLICTSKNNGTGLNLYLWHATALFGPWIPHVGNPIKTDCRSSRPGGTPFNYKGHLYRPAQDYSFENEWRLAINRITRLTPTEFSEKTVKIIDPIPKTPFRHGVHTLSKVGDLTLIDGKRHVFTLRKITAKIARVYK